MSPKKYETEAIVLDYLPSGHYGDGMPSYKRVPIAQLLGTNFFSLLEVVPKEELSTHDRVFIGKGDRAKISHVKRRVHYNELTSYAKSELEEILKVVVTEQEDRFVHFFNNARPISIRSHQLELLPGIGKKLMKELLAEREKKPFENFHDIQERVGSVPDPVHMLVKRILAELNEEDRYKVFVR